MTKQRIKLIGNQPVARVTRQLSDRTRNIERARTQAFNRVIIQEVNVKPLMVQQPPIIAPINNPILRPIVYVAGSEGKCYKYNENLELLETLETGHVNLTVNGIGIHPLTGKLYLAEGWFADDSNGWGVSVMNGSVLETFYNQTDLHPSFFAGAGFPKDILFNADGTFWMQVLNNAWDQTLELASDEHFFLVEHSGSNAGPGVQKSSAIGPASIFLGGRWSASGTMISMDIDGSGDLGSSYGKWDGTLFATLISTGWFSLGDVKLLPPGDGSGGAIVTAFWDGYVARLSNAGNIMWQTSLLGASRVALSTTTMYVFASIADYLSSDPPWDGRLYRLNIETGAIELGPVLVPPLILDPENHQPYRGAIYVQGGYHPALPSSISI